jgi:hypothetical protein
MSIRTSGSSLADARDLGILGFEKAGKDSMYFLHLGNSVTGSGLATGTEAEAKAVLVGTEGKQATLILQSATY